MKKIIILGGSGFIGTSLIPKLENKFNVKVMIHQNNHISKIQSFRGDILAPISLEKEISKGCTVINLIGQSSSNSRDAINVNVLGGINLLNICVKKHANVILLSSINVYGENLKTCSKETNSLNSITPYGSMKIITEKIYEYYSKFHNLDVTILRLSHIYGPNKKIGIISNLINSCFNKKSITFHNHGKQLRDFLYIDDAINGIIQTLENHLSGFTVLNISSGKRYAINDIVKIIEEITSKKLNISFDSKFIDEKCVCADNSKARKLIDFKPQIGIEKGLRLTINNIKNRNKLR